MSTKIDRLIAEAEKWVGYLEKKSNSQLDSFTANAGSNNYIQIIYNGAYPTSGDELFSYSG